MLKRLAPHDSTQICWTCRCRRFTARPWAFHLTIRTQSRARRQNVTITYCGSRAKRNLRSITNERIHGGFCLTAYVTAFGDRDHDPLRQWIIGLNLLLHAIVQLTNSKLQALNVNLANIFHKIVHKPKSPAVDGKAAKSNQPRNSQSTNHNTH